MSDHSTNTRFHCVTPGRARLILISVLLGILACVALSLFPDTQVSQGGSSKGDLATYESVIERMRHGDPYYASAHEELIAGGFGTRSVFNWRTPLYPHLLAAAPSTAFAQFALAGVALLASTAAVALISRERRRVVLYVGAFAVAMSLLTTLIVGTVLFAEVAAGVLILLSVGLFGLGHRRLGFVVGALALFVRELSAVYALVALAIAARERRWGECLAWLTSFVAYAAYFSWHAQQVSAQVTENDPAYPSGWVQFGGPGFVLRTAHTDGVLFALPLVVTAVLLPLALLGLTAWRAPVATRVGLTVGAYMLLFAVVGKPFNFYWGAMYTPLLVFGFAIAPAALADLARNVRRTDSPNGLLDRSSA